MKGTIEKDGSVKGKDGKTYLLDWRGKDAEGYPKVIMDAKKAGGRGWMQSQSIKPFIGKTVEFAVSPSGTGYNYEIIP